MPTITSVTVPSGTYKAGQTIDVTVSFSENVTVNTSGGTPGIALTIGSDTKYAAYSGGSGSSALLFRYTVEVGCSDDDGIEVGGFSLNGGTIRDAAGNNAELTLHSIGNTASVNVDTIAPPAPTLSISTDTGSSASDGVTNTAAPPKDSVSRAEVAVMVQRLLKKSGLI